MYVGQKIVCVNVRHWPRGFGYKPTLPKKGSVYTIRAIVPCRVLYGLDEDGLHLVEIVNPTQVSIFKFELAFRMSRFRPVHTTSIEVFEKMLEPVPAKRDLEPV